MEIFSSELRGDNDMMPVEVDCGQLQGKVMTIKYDQDSKRYVLADVDSGEIHYSYTRLSQLVMNTNRIFQLNDKGIDD